VLSRVRDALQAEFETPRHERPWGAGWISGVAGLLAACAGLFFVLCLHFPDVLTLPALRASYSSAWFRFGLHLLLLTAFVLSAVSLLLRTNKVLGLASMTITLVATALGGSRVDSPEADASGVYLGLDWFVLNLAFTGLLFVPLERLFPRRREQQLFRTEWREDLFYYLVSSLFVQVLTLISMAPTTAILGHTSWTTLRAWVGGQWVWVQVLEIMFLTDLVQYWVHRMFHQVPALWEFHAVHHSSKSMDWMASARMHVLEIIVLRGTTVIPMFVLGFTEVAIYAYLLLVYLHSSLVHANVGWNLNRIGGLVVTPRFHHWHHGIDREAIDVNFAIHFPLFDRLFGTFYLPRDEWPSGYGIGGHPVPRGYWQQFLHPFRRREHRDDSTQQATVN
jgi:sterol desaturase/sphingolipid hydroxylase (fatty acid hydroxylase superfamily)